MTDKRDTTETGWFRKGSRKTIAIATGIAIAIGGVFGVQALADSKTYGHMKLYASNMGGGHGGHHTRFADLSDADIEAQIERIVKHAAIAIDSTQEQQDKIARERKGQVGTGDRSEKIRTYNFHQTRVTDHRINLTLHRLEGILDGDLEEILDSIATLTLVTFLEERYAIMIEPYDTAGHFDTILDIVSLVQSKQTG